jgi:hypothetical protein
LAQTQHIDIDAALKTEQERLATRKQELESELSDINSKLSRIERYFTDEPAPRRLTVQPVTGARQQTGERHPRGFVKNAVKTAINLHPQGITNAEIVALLKEQQIGYQSIQNALGGLVDDGSITSEGKGGKYHPASSELTTAPDQRSA